MGKVITPDLLTVVREQLKKEGKKVVLVGGCFDILHRGHVVFLAEAAKQGQVLFVLLESDTRIRELKGEDRPVNTQNDRAAVLSASSNVTYVVLLPPDMIDADYDQVVRDIAPDVIAVTQGDTQLQHKERTAKLVGAKVVSVTPKIRGYSTTGVVKRFLNTVN